MRELGRYKVTVMVTVDLVGFTYREAYTGAIDVVQDALLESGMGGSDLRVTGIAKDSDGSDMVYRYGEVVLESLITPTPPNYVHPDSNAFISWD